MTVDSLVYCSAEPLISIVALSTVAPAAVNVGGVKSIVKEVEAKRETFAFASIACALYVFKPAANPENV